MIKTLTNVGIETKNCKIIKAIMIRFKAFPIKPGTRQGCQLSSLLFNVVLEALATTIRQIKEIKGIQIGGEEVKL